MKLRPYYHCKRIRIVHEYKDLSNNLIDHHADNRQTQDIHPAGKGKRESIYQGESRSILREVRFFRESYYCSKPLI